MVTKKKTKKVEETIGQRLARLRKERGITQEEISNALEVSQPVVSDYERGGLRLHAEQIVLLAKLMRVSTDELLGLEAQKRNGGAKNVKLARRIQQIEQLPQRDQQAIFRTIDAFISKGA